MNDTIALSGALERAGRHAPFLRQLIEQNRDLVDILSGGDCEGALAHARARAAEESDVARSMRIERNGHALVLAIGDLAEVFSFEKVIAELSALADRTLDRSIRTAIAERAPGAGPEGFAALALGKHGSGELNYSSDIDPILIFDPAVLPHTSREEPVEAAARIARRVVQLMQARDGDGYVFRVDLRLRPSPEATPPALPVEAALSYYESSALPWERAAFIRSRAAAGDLALGQYFLNSIRPFVWRRGLDYGAIAEIRGISRRIRDHHAQGQRLGPGFDLKRGRGGIREVEFYAQIHQMIYGGRETQLRTPATLDALAALAQAGRIGEEEAIDLSSAYRLYRTIEHRLQMVDDRQTHSLPKDIDALDGVAQLHGLENGRALVGLLRGPTERVGQIYDSLDDEAGETEAGVSHDPSLLESWLADIGFPDPATAQKRISKWRDGSLRAVRTDAAREALERVLPGLLVAIGQSPDPQQALNRLDDVITRLPSALNLFRLLDARPALARLLGDILSHAPVLAELLARRPELLDGLIDKTALELPPPLEALVAECGRTERGADYQQLLDSVRITVNERRFALGVQIVEGAQDPIDVAAGYARVAEAAIEILAARTVAEFEAAHGRVPESELLILGLGRLGGGALTNASDLDLIYVFTGDYAAESDGKKPLGAVHYYNRLAQRISAALSVPTAAGPLYEVDTRLRPSGAQGPLTVSLDAFERYQREEAWTWEHMALTRARPVFGSEAGRTQIASLITDVLSALRDPGKLLQDAEKMRADMAKHKPPAGPLDVKLVPGGLVDLEFCVHVSQLRYGKGLNPALRQAIAALEAERVLPAGLNDAHILLVRMLGTLRLVSPSCDYPDDATKALVARACRIENWDALLEAYADARRKVSDCWMHIFGSVRENA